MFNFFLNVFELEQFFKPNSGCFEKKKTTKGEIRFSRKQFFKDLEKLFL